MSTYATLLRPGAIFDRPRLVGEQLGEGPRDALPRSVLERETESKQ